MKFRLLHLPSYQALLILHHLFHCWSEICCANLKKFFSRRCKWFHDATASKLTWRGVSILVQLYILIISKKRKKLSAIRSKVCVLVLGTCFTCEIRKKKMRSDRLSCHLRENRPTQSSWITYKVDLRFCRFHGKKKTKWPLQNHIKRHLCCGERCRICKCEAEFNMNFLAVFWPLSPPLRALIYRCIVCIVKVNYE